MRDDILDMLDVNKTLRSLGDYHDDQIDMKLEANRRMRVEHRAASERHISAILDGHGLYMPEVVKLTGEYLLKLDPDDVMPSTDQT